MTTTEAKRHVRRILKRHGLCNRISGHKVSFMDLARAGAVFVTVHAWTPNPEAAADLQGIPGVIVNLQYDHAPFTTAARRSA